MKSARVLTMERAVVPRSDRERYVERLRARRDYYRGAGCNYWVFEEADLPGAFVEFTEAGDAKVLAAALEAAPDPVRDSRRVYREVELT